MAYLFWTIALLLFSSLEVVSKPIMGEVDPFTMTFMRFFIGGLFLFFISVLVSRLSYKKALKNLVKGEKITSPRYQKIIRADFLKIVFIGSLNTIFSMTMLQLSVKYGNASSAATLISTSPLFTALFAYLIISEKVSKRKKFGIVLGLVGIIIFGFGMLEGDTLAGILFGIIAAVTFGMYSVLLRIHIARYGPLRCTAYSTLIPSLIYGFFLIITGQFTIPALDAQGWVIVFYLGICVTGIAYYALLEAVNRMGATIAMRLFYVKPVVATAFALSFLSEPVGPIKIIGMGIIIFSLFL
ncbi:MAG: EamA family transporter [Thermotogota bacterium]|nr:EamA family transporter [Thermotogota bacterium]